MGDTIAERIERRLRATGQSARAASLGASLSGAFIQNILKGKSQSPRGENLERLARQLETTEIWLLRGEGPEEAARPPRTAARSEVVRARVPVPDLAGLPRDVPVYGSAGAALVSLPTRGKPAEGFVLDRSKISDHVGRPPGIAGTTDAYAIYVAGSSMVPKIEPGELRFVHPHRPYRPGDVVLVLVRAGENLPSQAFVKIFRGRTAQSIVAEQFNPKALIEFKAATVEAVHKVLDYAELAGA